MNEDLDLVIQRLNALIARADEIRRQKKLPPRPGMNIRNEYFLYRAFKQLNFIPLDGKLLPGNLLPNILKVMEVEEKLERESNETQM